MGCFVLEYTENGRLIRCAYFMTNTRYFKQLSIDGKAGRKTRISKKEYDKAGKEYRIRWSRDLHTRAKYRV